MKKKPPKKKSKPIIHSDGGYKQQTIKPEQKKPSLWKRVLLILKYAALPFVFIGFKIQELSLWFFNYVITNNKFWVSVIALTIAILMLLGILWSLGFFFAAILPSEIWYLFFKYSVHKDNSMFWFFPDNEHLMLLGMMVLVILIVLTMVLTGLAMLLMKVVPDNWRKSKITLGIE